MKILHALSYIAFIILMLITIKHRAYFSKKAIETQEYIGFEYSEKEKRLNEKWTIVVASVVIGMMLVELVRLFTE